MKIFFFGTPEFAVPTLEKLLNNSNFEVVGIITQPDKRRGRGNQLTPSAVKQVALAHNLPIWQPKRLKKSPKTLEILKNSGADAFVVVAYGQLLSPEILAMPKLGCINVHGSILPKYRGAAPLQWSLVNGEAETGITTMLMDEGMDLAIGFHGLFWIYSVFSLVGAIFGYVFIPETKGKTLKEIEAHFVGNSITAPVESLGQV